MDTEKLLQITRSILAQPTAPFFEDAVRAEIILHLSQYKNVKVEVDGFGNILAKYRSGDVAPRWLISSHMDHPAYVMGEFLGGVPARYLEKSPPTRDFGAFAMWDLPAFEIREGLIFSRACDDLIGCSVMVSVVHELEAMGVEAAVDFAFTCAEEVGLLGAVYIAKEGRFPKSMRVLSLETSAERPPAKMGQGVIIRTGDRTSIFDSQGGAELVYRASELSIPHQRCLMSGGTCEATAYRLYGYRASGLCVALGNYHNCGPDEQIAPEFVSVIDVQSMVRLCVATATQVVDLDCDERLKAQLESRLADSSARWRI